MFQKWSGFGPFLTRFAAAWAAAGRRARLDGQQGQPFPRPRAQSMESERNVNKTRSPAARGNLRTAVPLPKHRWSAIEYLERVGGRRADGPAGLLPAADSAAGAGCENGATQRGAWYTTTARLQAWRVCICVGVPVRAGNGWGWAAKSRALRARAEGGARRAHTNQPRGTRSTHANQPRGTRSTHATALAVGRARHGAAWLAERERSTY